MDLITLKSGLGLAVIGVATVCVLFVFYWKLGQVTLAKRQKKVEAECGTDSSPLGSH